MKIKPPHIPDALGLKKRRRRKKKKGIPENTLEKKSPSGGAWF